MTLLTPHQDKVLKTRGNISLTANAGSGKTFVLARKYFNLLNSGEVDIQNIAAITFTEKAASELYKKISELIAEEINKSTSKENRKHLEKLRSQLISANISTIHSFCISILKEYPVEAQLDARFTPIDQKLADELIELTVDEVIQNSFLDIQYREKIKLLIRLFSSKSKLKSQITELVKDRKNVFAVQKEIYNSKPEDIADFFFNEFNEKFLSIWQKLSKDFFENLNWINLELLNIKPDNDIALNVKRLLNELGIEQDIKKIISLIEEIKTTAFTTGLNLKNRGYLTTDYRLPLADRIKSVEEIMSEISKFNLPENHKDIELELAKTGIDLLNIFDRAVELYESKKQTDGLIDYEDILIHTKILLENEFVRNELGSKYKYIFVDEYQDTDETQYQIFLPILDYLKKGKMFIVGDEKQSIYRFRDAEIEIFDQTRNDIKNKEGDDNLLELPDSFRMSPAICVFTNYLFRKLFSNPDPDYGEVKPTDIVCANLKDRPGKIQFLISKKALDTKYPDESELIGGKILNLINEKVYDFKDITVLVRKRKHFTDLENIFIKYNIPFTIVGGRGFYQRQTISDVLNYLNFIVDENNSAALVGILRSPFYSVSDRIIFEVSLLKGKNFWNKLTQAIIKFPHLGDICKTLEYHLHLSNSLDFAELIQTILNDTNYYSVLSNRIDGSQEISNLEKLINIARNFNSTGLRNIYDFIDFLKDSINNFNDEAQASVIEDKNAVNIMTIHQAKGLEFKVVFIYKTGDAGLSDSIKSKEVKVSKKFGILTKLPLNSDYLSEYKSAPILEVYNYFEKKKNIAELKRLLYVAVTRAISDLYISASIEKSDSFKSKTFLQLLNAGLESDFSSDSIIIKDELKILEKEGDNFVSRKERFNLHIPIVSEIDLEIIDTKIEKSDFVNYSVNLSKIASEERGEIISASKVSIYSQCPVKYLLNYEYGFGKLNSKYLKNKFKVESENDLTDQNEDEDNSNLFTSKNLISNDLALYGKVVHRILELDANEEKFDDILNSFGISHQKDGDFYKSLLQRLKNEIGNYYNSKTYREIKLRNNFSNEFEIYLKENDYYLNGIIDRITFDEKNISIFDYKTDDIEFDEISKHAEFYSMQLKFYLYIASKLYKQFESFTGNLIFIKYPDNPVTFSYSKLQVNKLKEEIYSIIAGIRKKVMYKNYGHCKMCSFADSNFECIYK